MGGKPQGLLKTFRTVLRLSTRPETGDRWEEHGTNTSQIHHSGHEFNLHREGFLSTKTSPSQLPRLHNLNISYMEIPRVYHSQEKTNGCSKPQTITSPVGIMLQNLLLESHTRNKRHDSGIALPTYNVYFSQRIRRSSFCIGDQSAPWGVLIRWHSNNIK